jgi:hypothetical protein
MSKFLQTTKLPIAFFGSVGLLAVVSAMPAAAQGVPAGLLRLDSVATTSASDQLREVDRTQLKSRGSYAHERRVRNQNVER